MSEKNKLLNIIPIKIQEEIIRNKISYFLILLTN